MSESKQQTALSIADRDFLTYWQQLDVSGWNEMDVREEFVTPLLKRLGYGAGTLNKIHRERSLDLSSPYHRVGRKKIRIDYVPTIRLAGFWIIEAKPGNEELSFGDFLQAHLYAVHPEVNASLIMLTNGTSLLVYNAVTPGDPASPFIECTQENCFETFPTVRDCLGSENMTSALRARLLTRIEETLSVELEVEAVDGFLRAAKNAAGRARSTVRSNASKIFLDGHSKRLKRYRQTIHEAEDDILLKVHMNMAGDGFMEGAEEFARRLDQSSETEGIERLKRAGQIARSGTTHTVYFVGLVYALVRLLGWWKQKEFDGVPEKLEDRAKANLFKLVTLNSEYWRQHPSIHLRCHLDNACHRIAAVAVSLAGPELDRVIQDVNASLSSERRIRMHINREDESVRILRVCAEKLFRRYINTVDETELRQAIWEVTWFEEKLNEARQASKLPLLDTFWGFEEFGRKTDLLAYGTWLHCSREANLFNALNAPAEVVHLIQRPVEDVIAEMPKSPAAPDGWEPQS